MRHGPNLAGKNVPLPSEQRSGCPEAVRAHSSRNTYQTRVLLPRYQYDAIYGNSTHLTEGYSPKRLDCVFSELPLLRGSRQFATASNSHRSTHVAVSSTKDGTYERYAAYLKYANVRTGRVRYLLYGYRLNFPARPSFVRSPPVLCGLHPPVKGGVYLPHNTLRWFYHSGGLGPLGPGPSRNARPLPRGSIHENGFGASRNGHY